LEGGHDNNSGAIAPRERQNSRWKKPDPFSAVMPRFMLLHAGHPRRLFFAQ
jgi:hypothetical protein